MIRASRLTARPLTARKLIAYKLGQGPVTGFDPLRLFRNAEEGTFLDFTPTQVYADTLGTDPAEVGEGIAFIDDKSPNDTDATQATSTARPIFRLTSGVYNAEFDLTDDILPITLPAITGGTVALVGLNGIWIEDNWDYAGGTLSIGPTTIAGLPAGILGVVGDLCAVIINDRAWTAAERAGVVAWGKARGAPGVFSLGPELVTNGTFDTDVSGWTVASPVTMTWSSGSAIIARNSGGLSAFPKQTVFEVGKLYELSFDVIARSNLVRIYSDLVSVTASNSTPDINSAGSFSYVIAPTTTDIHIGAVGASSATATVDNISVRKLELIP